MCKNKKDIWPLIICFIFVFLAAIHAHVFVYNNYSNNYLYLEEHFETKIQNDIANDYVITNIDNQIPIAFFDVRKPLRQSTIRVQRRVLQYITHNREISSFIFKKNFEKKHITYKHTYNSFAYIYSFSKDYYVYTLKHILC